MSGLEAPPLDRLRTVRSVTLRQLQNAELVRDNLYRIDGKDVDQITFVGSITHISVLSAGIAFDIEDGTGMISTTKWLEPTDEDPGFESILQEIENASSYVRVCGSLRYFKGRPSVIAQTVKPIQSGNEMMYHLLEAIAQHLHITRGPFKPAYEMQIDGMMYDGQGTQQLPPSQYQASAAGTRIMAYLSSLADNNMLPADGVRDNIIAQETGLSRSIVADQIWKLLELGMVYHGHDENHIFPTAT